MGSLKIKQILKRYLEGKSTPAEEQTVDNWYRKLDDEAPVKITGAKEDRVREEIWKSIQATVNPEPAVVKQLNYNWLKAAAAILVFGAVGLLLWQNNYKAPVAARVDAGYTTISTKTGERKLVNLPDGTVLTLNSASSIRINNDFTKRRDVNIADGEVYFDVKHDATRPFVIKSGPLTTQVLGTAFNIRAYRELKKMSVGVTQGKVGVMVAHEPARFLVKGQQLVFDKRKAKISLSRLDEGTLAWQKGYLVLNDASFYEMAVLINKQYGVHVTTAENTIQHKHFTATLNTSMSSVKVLEVIAAIHHLKIKQRRDTVEIFR